MTIAEEYAAYAADLSVDDIPDHVLEYAKDLTLDALGLMVGGERYARSSESVAAAVRQLGEGGRDGTVLATGECVTPQYAAMLNGTFAHSLDFDDTHQTSSVHPGAPVIATALAAAEHTDASGRDLLTGIVAGYETTCRLGMAVNAASHYDRGFHGTGTCGTFGAAVTTATIFDLPAEEIAASLGIAGSQASGSLQFLANGAWNKRIHPGLAAHDGFVAATLAREGFRAATAPIEGENGFLTGYTDEPRPDLDITGLGSTYELRWTGIKPYPCCRYMHASLDLLLDLARSEDLDPGTVQSITVNLPSVEMNIVESDAGSYPDSLVDAQFNIRFGAVLALTRRAADVTAFVDTLTEPYTETFQRLYDETALESRADIDERYPDEWAARVVVETADQTYERRTKAARGEAENPLSEAELAEKFRALLSDHSVAAEPVRNRVEALEEHHVANLVEPFADG
jgi:2-methylcitrate dehydratase PrpD